MGEELGEPCASIVFMTNLVYDRGVALEYDLVHDRLEDAERRLADLEDMMPQVYGLTELTTPEERADLVRGLGKVRQYIQEGDTVMGQGAADEFNASFRNTMWNIIIRCKGGAGQRPPRPLPETYGDWVNLAMDIKERMPEGAWGVVNDLLQVIAEGGPEAEEAKRWLTAKAGELGIS